MCSHFGEAILFFLIDQIIPRVGSLGTSGPGHTTEHFSAHSFSIYVEAVIKTRINGIALITSSIVVLLLLLTPDIVLVIALVQF
jgi:hypothetical protein